MKKIGILFFVSSILALLVAGCGQVLKSVGDNNATKEPKEPEVPELIMADLEAIQEDVNQGYENYYNLLPDSLLIHVSAGIPIDADTTDDYLIFRSQYATSYNASKGVPNWVSWHLDASWFGTSGRYSGNFITDNTLPLGMFRATHAHYTNTGFDRGHVVRSHERTNTAENNRSTFLMTNIVPQTPDLNRGVWLNFERFCEKLCLQDSLQLFIISGGVNRAGLTLSNQGQIAIPDSCFKIVIATNTSNIDSTASVYAVMMPNIQGIRNDAWERYATTIRQIEQSTGYDFLNKLSLPLQEYLETMLPPSQH